MELEWQLPRGNPRFYMHSLISLSEIYGGRGLRHFSSIANLRLFEPFLIASSPVIAFSRSFSRYVSPSLSLFVLLLFFPPLQFIIPRCKL